VSDNPNEFPASIHELYTSINPPLREYWATRLVLCGRLPFLNSVLGDNLSPGLISVSCYLRSPFIIDPELGLTTPFNL